MRKISIIIVFALLCISAMAQKLTFHSAEFEMGVKMHLGLGENDDVQQNQADTITAIDLSGLGIKDIRDVIYLPNVEILNLSNNVITNTFPLTVLDSLRLLNLCNNELESINPLVFSNANKMQVLIAYNYISDFSYFLTPAKCQITLVGMNMQQVKGASYFDVYRLFVDINAEGNPVVFYRGYTNIDSTPYVECAGVRTNAQMDGNTYSIIVPGNPKTATIVCLTNGEKADTTWVLPPTRYEMIAGETFSITTGLPEKYTIGNVYAKNGTVVVDGTSINYTASNDFETETLCISYYEGKKLRGFTEYHLVNPEAANIHLGDVNMDGFVNIVDLVMTVNHILGIEQNNFHIENADMDLNNDINVTDVIMMVNKILDK